MNDDLDSLEPIDVAAEARPAGAGAPPSAAAGAPPSGWPEGWYADPWTAGQYRYWSGHAWTGATHRWGPAHAPAAGAVTTAWPAPPSGRGVPAVPLQSEPAAPPRRRGTVVAAIVALVAVLVASGRSATPSTPTRIRAPPWR